MMPMEREAPRSPPYDIEVEQALLGAILVDNHKLGELGGEFCGDHFYDPVHRRLFGAMVGIQARGMTIAPLTVHASLKGDPGLQEVGGHAYLVNLVQAAQAKPEVHDYATILTELANRRAVVQIGEDVINAAYETPHNCSIAQQIDAALGAFTRIESLAASELVTVRASSFAGQPIPELEELAEGLIPKNAVTGLGGEGGAGKSLLALMLAIAIQIAANWLGKIVYARGPVLYLSAEDDIKIVHRRTAAIAEHEGVSLERLHHLHILPLVGEDAILGSPAPDGVIAPTVLFRRIERLVREIKPVLIIADSQANIFGGDEIKRAHARQFVDLLRRLCVKEDTTLLLLTHPSLDGMKTGTGTSGSTAWSNTFRSRLYLTTSNAEDDPDARVLKVMKANYGPKGGEIRMRWERGVFVVAGGPESPSVAAATARTDRIFMELLTAYTAEGRNVGPNKGHSFAPSIFEDDSRAQGIKSRAFIASMNRLLEQHRIEIETTGPKSRQSKRLVVAGGAK